MPVCLALLRGINVGGRTLPMKELTAILVTLGASRVQTYIQSGNAVFVHAAPDLPRLARQITAEIQQRRGFEPHVLLLTPADLARVIRQNPFPEAEADPVALHVGFLAEAPARPDLEKLEGWRLASERFQLRGRAFYLHAPAGFGRSKLAANAERALGVPLTDRNWRTVLTLQQILQDLSRQLA